MIGRNLRTLGAVAVAVAALDALASVAATTADIFINTKRVSKRQG